MEYASQNQLEKAFLEACQFQMEEMATNLLKHLTKKRAAHPCFDITNRAALNIDWEMLNTIMEVDHMVYDRYRLDDNLVYEFKPLLILAPAVIRPDVSREDLLKVWNKMVFHYADPDSEDDAEANVLHYLPRSGAVQYVRTKPEEETFNDLYEPSLEKSSDCNIMDNNGNFAWDFDNWHQEEEYKALACIVYDKGKEQLRYPQPREKDWMDTGRITEDRDDVNVKEYLAAFAKKLKELEKWEEWEDVDEAEELEGVEEVDEVEVVVET